MAARLAISIDPKADLPPSEQLVQQVCFAVASGAVSEGERLPSVRVLAVDASVNPNTVGKAWRDLERMAVLDSRPGDGVFVARGAVNRARAARDAWLQANPLAVSRASQTMFISNIFVTSGIERTSNRPMRLLPATTRPSAKGGRKKMTA